VILAWIARFYMVRPFAITPWNPSAGLALAFLLIFGIRFWPALAVAAVSTSLLLRGMPAAPYTQLLAPVVLTAGYVAMAALLRGPLRFHLAFDRQRDIVNLAAVSIVGTFLMALANVAIFRSASAMTEQDFGPIMLRYWIGHLIGIVVNTPLLLILLARENWPKKIPLRALNWENAAIAVSVPLTLWTIFGLHWADPYKLFYLLFLPVIWIATRHGIKGAIVGIAAVQIGLIVALINTEFQSNTAVTEFQFMMLALAIAGLFLGMVVTQNRLAQLALARSESRLRTTLSTAPNSIITIGPDNRIVDANPATKRMFDLPKHQSNDLYLQDILPNLGADDAEIEDCITEGMRGDGTRFPVEVSIGRTGEPGARVRIAVIRNISRRIESARRLAEQQEELGRAARLAAAGEMAAALAHELHQPLSAIRSYARAAQMQNHGSSGVADKIEHEATRAAAVVQRLRDFFRGGTSSLEAVSVDALIEGAVAQMRDIAAHAGIALETSINGGDTILLVDRIQIDTVIHSLVHNAVEAMAGATARRRLITVSTHVQNDGWVRVAVSDTGPGIPAAMSERIFEPFATTKATGTGMGLAMSRSMIEAHGGRIWFATSGDSGTVFRFTLPTTAHHEAVA
jgi:two-component system sensor kinase FixL